MFKEDEFEFKAETSNLDFPEKKRTKQYAFKSIEN